MERTTVWGTIDGQTITFPMEVEAFNAATLTYSVPAPAAAALLPGDAFELVQFSPGTAHLVVAACDYRHNPWGDYNELNLGFLARPAGAPADVVGSFVYRMPVDQPFTCEAGNRVMGFPKTVETIDVDYGGGDGPNAANPGDGFTFRVSSGGRLALALSLARRPEGAGPPARIATDSYSYLDGRPYATTLEMDLGAGVVDPADVTLELGQGPLADELRSLGLPAPPDSCAWGEGLSATFQLGRPLPNPAPAPAPAPTN